MYFKYSKKDYPRYVKHHPIKRSFLKFVSDFVTFLLLFRHYQAYCALRKKATYLLATSKVLKHCRECIHRCDIASPPTPHLQPTLTNNSLEAYFPLHYRIVSGIPKGVKMDTIIYSGTRLCVEKKAVSYGSKIQTAT